MTDALMKAHWLAHGSARLLTVYRLPGGSTKQHTCTTMDASFLTAEYGSNWAVLTALCSIGAGGCKVGSRQCRYGMCVFSRLHWCA